MTSTSFFKRHPKLSLIIFNVVMVLFILLIFEILLRIFAPDWLKYRMHYLNTGSQYGYGSDASWKVEYRDGKFYSFIPNSSFKMYHEEYEKTVHINNLGGRSTVPNEVADTNKLIPFTGDSFIMGVGVEDTETMVAIIKKKFNYNLLNLGVGGSCLPIQRDIIDARYNELGRPKLIVFGVFLGNDFDDIIKEYAKKSLPDSLSAKSNKKEDASESGFAWKLNNFVNNNSFLKKLYFLQYIKQKIINLKQNGRNKVRDNIDPVFLITNSSDTSYLRQAKDKMDNELRILSQEPYKSIVILIPDRYQVNSSIRKNMCDYYNLDPKMIKPFLPNQLLIELLTKYKIKYIDPTECISGHMKDGALYYTKDNHFTKLGQKVFSNCIADTLNSYIKNVLSQSK